MDLHVIHPLFSLSLQRDRHRIEELKWIRVTRWALLYPHMMHEWSVGESANEPEQGSIEVHWLSDMGEQNLVRTVH
jgi:hypothetical protein